ncbi:MAG TPA: bifunctional 2-C-methyl-D-erythritol 4-phosphate cytidylyltransferase/2-C-methyl-D-erythritol 2,4-cyclodiphosphate synthase [Beijerinckiaceae bacterium]|jgi:2-C-methyl-D-erythritol 4-phosphate cytidylyltransferase/2-C-methyl-D-erythritol 2,4-cyclodiphosphate synthase
MDSSDVAIVLVAAGRGLRAGAGAPKQYRRVGGRPVVRRTIEALAAGAPGATIVPVIHPDDAALFAEAVAGCDAALAAPVPGGATRQASVRAGLAAMPAGAKVVLIHDAARAFCSPALVRRAIEAARTHGAAIPALPVTDALAAVDADGRLSGPVDRTRLRAAQTPQAFDAALIRAAHAAAAAAGRDDFPDDAAVAAFAGAPVHVFPGEPGNVKLTTPEDFAMAEARVFAALPDLRTGSGFDVHAFGPGDHVWLGGVRIPHDQALVGHSDADVLLHALTDAILGALADGDLGAHFPPSDPQWKGAASDRFLQDACARVAARGGVIAHLDGTIICEAPKVGPHREAIRASVARIAGLDIGRVAVKATTTEKLGFAGRREGVAAQAVATIRLPLETP